MRRPRCGTYPARPLLSVLVFLAPLLPLTACAGVAGPAVARTAPVLARGPVGTFVADVARGLLVEATKTGALWAINHYHGPDDQVDKYCYRDETRGDGFFVAHHSGGTRVVYVNAQGVYVDLLPRAWQAITSTVNELHDANGYDSETARAYVVPHQKVRDGSQYVRYEAEGGPVTVTYDRAAGTEVVTIDALRTTWTYTVDPNNPSWLTDKPGTVTDPAQAAPQTTGPTDEVTPDESPTEDAPAPPSTSAEVDPPASPDQSVEPSTSPDATDRTVLGS